MKLQLRRRNLPDVPDMQVQSCTVFHAIPRSQFLAVLPAVAEELELLHKLLRIYNHGQLPR